MRLIDADDYCRNAGCEPPYGNGGECTNCSICNCPTIEAEPVKRGLWIKVKSFWKDNTYKCSLCGNFLDFNGVNAGRGSANVCPNCGAKMTGGEP